MSRLVEYQGDFFSERVFVVYLHRLDVDFAMQILKVRFVLFYIKR